jgi:putative Holliday junction resolvase
MTRYLGIDYGSKRIGLAVGEPQTAPAAPLTTLQGKGAVDNDVRAVTEVAEEYAIDAFVIGLPLNMDDTEGPQAKLTRQFGDALARATSLPVHYIDERLSSFAAEELLRPAELTRGKKRARLDRIAAQVILKTFFDSQRPDQETP